MSSLSPSLMSSPSQSAEHGLDAAPRGVQVEVVGVDGDDAVSERLAASGIWQGAVLERIASAPFGGPLLYRLHGYRLALRRTEASRVRVVVCSERDAKLQAGRSSQMDGGSLPPRQEV